MVVLWVFLAVLVIAFMIITHEMGHFFAAKAVGIKAETFSIGFGPEIVGWTRGGTRYAIKWFLVGGSVKILGMDPNEEISEEDLPRSYTRASYWKRAVVILAGSFVHIVIAFILLYIYFWPVGYQMPTGRIQEVLPTWEVTQGEKVPTPAAEAGLKKDDLITSVNGVKVKNWYELQDQLNKNPGKVVTLTISRGDETVTNQVKLLDVGGEGKLGVEANLRDTYTVRSNPLTAVGQAFKALGMGTVAIGRGLGSLFSLKTLKMIFGVTPRTQEGPMSVVGGARIAIQAAGAGSSVFIFVLAQLFLWLALFNLIPLPPFDGGHLLVIVVEKVFHKEIDIRKLTPIAVAVIVVLSVLAIRLMFLDVFNPLKNPFVP
jgi:membrane-associated protease RseP (regulator of RpoE activity)